MEDGGLLLAGPASMFCHGKIHQASLPNGGPRSAADSCPCPSNCQPPTTDAEAEQIQNLQGRTTSSRRLPRIKAIVSAQPGA